MKTQKTIFKDGEMHEKPKIQPLPLTPEVESKGREEGMKDMVKESVKKKLSDKHKLDRMVKDSHIILYQVSTVFPFKFFADTLTIEPNQLNLSFSNFFFSKQLISIRMQDIKAIISEQSLFFATLKIDVEGFRQAEQNKFLVIEYLKKNEATRARRIIQGLIACVKEKIDVTAFKPHELTKKTEQIGMIHGG